MNEFKEDQRRHIDIIEAIITRMSENSKQMKAWCIALVSGLIGVSFTIKIPWLCIVAALAVIVFCYLDAFYLKLERCFRRLYNDVVGIGNDEQPPKKVKLYDTSIGAYEKNVTIKSACESSSIRPFYIGMLVGVILLSGLAFFIECKDDGEKIKLTNDSFSLKIEEPLDVKLKEFDSLKVNINKIDSLIVKIDEIKKINLQIIDTVKTKNFVKKGN
jgi:hypothetical protein